MRIASRIAAVIIVAAVLLLLCGCYYGAKPYLTIVQNVCDDYAVEPELALAVIKAESNFNPDAVSRAGAIGIMQLLPTTAEWICALLGIEYRQAMLFDAEYNIRLGVWYLEYLSYFDDRDWQLAAYNAGEGKVREWQQAGVTVDSIPYFETRHYVEKVNNYYSLFKKRKFFN